MGNPCFHFKTLLLTPPGSFLTCPLPIPSQASLVISLSFCFILVPFWVFLLRLPTFFRKLSLFKQPTLNLGLSALWDLKSQLHRHFPCQRGWNRVVGVVAYDEGARCGRVEGGKEERLESEGKLQDLFLMGGNVCI